MLKYAAFKSKLCLDYYKKHCPVCGIDIGKGTAIKRFGKYFCSEKHADHYVQMKMERQTDRGRNGMRGGGGCC